MLEASLFLSLYLDLELLGFFFCYCYGGCSLVLLLLLCGNRRLKRAYIEVWGELEGLGFHFHEFLEGFMHLKAAKVGLSELGFLGDLARPQWRLSLPLL